MFDLLDTIEKDLLQFARDGFRLPDAFILENNDVGKALIQLAAGKSVDSLGSAQPLDSAQAAARREAAMRFVSGIMLAESSNYFLTLGVSPDVDSSTVRDNFRRLMALVHPDARPVGFPPDAASRVNRAYTVLSEAGSRATYATRELGISAFDPVVFNAEPTARRSNATTLEVHDKKPVGRFFGWLQTLRARQSLLWVAALLLLPLGAAVISLFSYEPPQRLVQARAKASSLPETVIEPSPITRSVETYNTPKQEQIAATALAPSAQASESVQLPSPATNRSVPHTAPPLGGTGGALVSTTPKNLPEAELIALKNKVSPADPVSPTAIPLTTARRPAVATNAEAGATKPLAASLAPEEPTRVLPSLDATPATTQPATTQPAAVRVAPAPLANADRMIEGLNRVKPSDAEAMVVRFSNAYESGSISAFGQLFAQNMSSRRQMLGDYERVFSATRQRTIKFNQLKHAMLGERLATSGYAVVTTTDQDNRIVTQRVFLEFEFGRDRGEPRIERLANYVIN